MRGLTVLALTALLAAATVADDRAGGETEQATDSPPNPVVFWELATHDGPKSVEFFSEVFGWQNTPVPGAQTYFHTLDTGGEKGSIDGGIFTLRKARPAFVAIYIMVDDIETKAEQVTAAGGLVVEAPQEIFPGTWVCLFNDPSGVTFAMLEKRPVTATG